MLSILKLIPLVGRIFDTVDSIHARITDKQIALINANSEEERARIEGEIRGLEARAKVLEASMTGPWGWITRVMQVALAMPVAIILWKILVIDQTLGWGTTPDLGKDMWWVIYTVVGFYFVASMIRRGGR